MKNSTLAFFFATLIALGACQKKVPTPPMPVPSVNASAEDFSDLKAKTDDSCAKEQLPSLPHPQETVKLQGGDSGCKNE